jgi:hypothetical protein
MARRGAAAAPRTAAAPLAAVLLAVALASAAAAGTSAPPPRRGAAGAAELARGVRLAWEAGGGDPASPGATITLHASFDAPLADPQGYVAIGLSETGAGWARPAAGKHAAGERAAGRGARPRRRRRIHGCAPRLLHAFLLPQAP